MTIISTKISVNLDKDDMKIIDDFANLLEELRCQMMDNNVDLTYECNAYSDLCSAMGELFLENPLMEFIEQETGETANWQNVSY